MTRVTDPSGSEWLVSREWFGLPRWAHRGADEVARKSVDALPHVGTAESLIGTLVVALGLFLLLVIGWIFILPIVVFLAGFVVAALALVARLVGLQAWRVEAKTEDRRLAWSVSGPLRSARAVRQVAAALARGDEPLIDGNRPQVVEMARV